LNTFSRGVRNAFRNPVRTIAIVIILGLVTGLSLTMLLARQAVQQKISSVKSSIGNTITISPAGFNNFSQVNNALTSSQLSKVQTLPHVINLTETLTDRLTTIGSSSPSFGFGNSSSSSGTNQTSLTSPVTINLDKNRTGNGGGFFIGGGSSLPSNFSPPVTIVGTNNPTSLNGTGLTISSGTTINGTADGDNALISTAMASKNNLKVGSTFAAYGTTLSVAGIFNATSSQVGSDNIIVSLPTEQSLSGQSGDVTSAVATVDSLDNLSSVTSNIKSILGSSADVESSQDQANEAIQPLNSVKSISLFSLIGAVVAGAVIILLVMIMIVRERKREIGVLKAIGASNVRIMLQFMSEAITLTILSAVIGLLIGIAAGSPVTNTLVSNSTNSSSTGTTTTSARSGGFGGGGFGGGGQTTFRRPTGGFLDRTGGGVRNTLSNIHANVGWSILLYGLASAVVIAVVGSALASILISKVRPAEVMRSE
jgi:putative ABC transport system permease protein